MEPQGFATATGKDNIRHVYDAIFSALVYDLQFTIDEVIVSGNYASVRSTSAGTVLNKATSETAPDANRELWLMQKVDGAWKIARYMFNKAGE
jgi:ketosteroid isomerase-like protein